MNHGGADERDKQTDRHFAQNPNVLLQIYNTSVSVYIGKEPKAAAVLF